MDSTETYEEEVKVLEAKNRSYLEGFKQEMTESGLSEKTIRSHITNVEFYINYYLNYEEPQEIKAGCYSIDRYLGSFFIRKALWSSASTIKSSASSIKKFYKYMLSSETVCAKDYQYLQEEIKTCMPEWLRAMQRTEESLAEIDMFDDLQD